MGLGLKPSVLDLSFILRYPDSTSLKLMEKSQGARVTIKVCVYVCFANYMAYLELRVSFL